MISGLKRKYPHYRLILAFLLGLLVVAISPTHLRWVTLALLGWNTSIWSYIFITILMMMRTDHAKIARIASQEDERGVIVLILLSIAALASLAAIVLELSGAKNLNTLHLIHYLFTFSTIFGSWCFVNTMFTVHYAHMYYRMPTKPRPLQFPGEDLPDYWDFLYFSFTVAVAAQTSDVTIASRSMRKAVLFQSILSFIFNAAIIGLCINIAAGLIS
ncbi:MAG: DUF1345 domain-containing protein [Methylophilaceae bacterium]